MVKSCTFPKIIKTQMIKTDGLFYCHSGNKHSELVSLFSVTEGDDDCQTLTPWSSSTLHNHPLRNSERDAGKGEALTSEPTAKISVRLMELMCKLWDGSIQQAQRSQTIDATNHFLHVRCHGLDPAAQPIVLGDHPVLLQSEPCEINQKK